MKTKINIMLPALLFFASAVHAQQGPPPGGKPQGPPPPPAEHSKEVTAKLEKDLSLNKEHSEKVATAYQAFFTSMEKVRGKDKQPPPPPPPPRLSPEQKKKADSLSAIRDEVIKKALTPAQFEKYKVVEKSMRPPRPPQGQGPPPAPQPPKQ